MITAPVRAADLSFDAGLHEYRRPDGRRVPSVTEVLSAVGVSTDFDLLRASSRQLAVAIDLKRDIGQALHADAHAFDDDDLEWATVDPRVEPYLRAWATVRENLGLTPTTRERRIYLPDLDVAGTLDGIFRLPTGRLVLGDLKTGDPDDAGCAYQTAAYAAGYHVEHPDEPLTERWGIWLQPDQQIPYRICRYTAWDDVQKFRAFVTTFTCQAARRREIAA